MKHFFGRAKYYAGYIWSLKLIFFAALATALIASVASGLGIPVVIYKVFPAVFHPETLPPVLRDFIAGYVAPAHLNKAILILACAALPVVFIFRGIAMWINGITMNYLGIRMLENIRLDVFSRLQTLPLAFHEKQQRGDLLSRIVTDAQNVQTMISQISADLIKQPLTAIAALGALVIVLWGKSEAIMFISSLIFAALAIAPVMVIGKRVVKKSRQSQKNIGEMTAVVQENLSAQREVRAYEMEAREVERMAETSQKFRIAQLKSVKYQQLLTPMLEIVTAIALAFILVQGRTAGMALTDFMAVAGALFFAFDSIKRTGLAYNKIKQAQASLERLEMILTATDTMPEPESPQTLEAVAGTVEFRNVSFEYEPGKPVLKNINLSVPAGQTVALVGPSGSGKTTFASLIPRFYDPTAGTVLVDGTDVRQLRKRNLRKFIALVSQFAVLFRDTILENIRLGKLDADDDAVKQAAETAALGDFLATQPQGIMTPLGESGEGVSGGQRQRIAIARAFLKNAPILILDEATAALDAESEKMIQNNLETLVQGRTSFIIAHRFSSIRIAQRILVFSHGNIIGDGSHDALYHSCPLYKDLYDRQGV